MQPRAGVRKTVAYRKAQSTYLPLYKVYCVFCLRSTLHSAGMSSERLLVLSPTHVALCDRVTMKVKQQDV